MSKKLMYAVVRKCDGVVVREFETVSERTAWLLKNYTGYCYNKRTDEYYDWEVNYCRVELVTKEEGEHNEED